MINEIVQSRIRLQPVPYWEPPVSQTGSYCGTTALLSTNPSSRCRKAMVTLTSMQTFAGSRESIHAGRR